MTLRCAQVDQRGEQLIVAALSSTPNEIWQIDDWIADLDTRVSDAQLGSAVLDALQHSTQDVEESDPDQIEPILKLADVSSWNQYMKGLRSVSIETENGITRVEPMRNLGAREGLEPMEEHSEELRGPTPDELGAAIRRGLAEAT